MSTEVIPLQDIVKVNITLQTLFAQRRNFGLPLFVTPETDSGIDQKERVKKYTTLAEVVIDWPTSSEAYQMAQTAFAQSPAPGELLIGVRFIVDQAGFLQCAPTETGVDEADFIAVTDGAFNVVVDGVDQPITGLDFSLDTTFTDFAVTITAALAGAVCTYDTTIERFVITSSTTGDTSEVQSLTSPNPVVGTDISGDGFINGTSDVSREVPGLTVGTIVDELLNIAEANNEWYFLCMTKETRDNQDVEDIADFIEAQANGRQFFTASNNRLLVDSSTINDIAAILQGRSLNRTWTQYSSTGDDYPDVSIMARASTVNFDGQNTMLTLKFKQMPTINPETGDSNPTFRSNELSVVEDKNANVYSIVGGLPQLASEAEMASGRFQDEIHFADWLANAIETNVFNIMFTSPTKIPYTEPGLDQLQTGIERALEQGVRNGGLAPNLNPETGAFNPAYTISRIPVSTIDPSIRASRVYPGFSFVGFLSGAIHSVKPIVGLLTIELV